MTDFFEPPPHFEEEPESFAEWERPPDAVVPGTIPVERMIARNDEAAVYLAALSAYPAGFVIDMFVVTADKDEELDPFDFEYRMVAQRTGKLPPGQLRLGLLFADGSKATNTGEYFRWYDESASEPPAPVMSPVSGRSEWGRWHERIWVWPLPPPGPLEFICEWPAAAIPLTRSDLDSAAIIDASSRAQPAFPAD